MTVEERMQKMAEGARTSYLIRWLVDVGSRDRLMREFRFVPPELPEHSDLYKKAATVLFQTIADEIDRRSP